MDTSKGTSLNRRALAKGATWAVPAVMASAAVPAYASSVCETKPPLKFDEKNRWVFQNTGSANLYSRDGFRAITYQQQEFFTSLSTVDYDKSRTDKPQIAVVRGSYEASNTGDTAFNPRCGKYRFKVDLISMRGAAPTENTRLYPTLVIRLIGPDGLTVPGTEQKFTTDPKSTEAGVKILPATGTTQPRPRYVTAATPVTFTPKAGMYYFEAKLTAPVNYSREAGVRDRNMQADGIGVTAPTFEFIGQ